MTLVERLEAFPLFCSTDGGVHWFKGAIAKEPLCLEAAARIRELEREVATLGLAAEAVGRLIAAIRDNCPHVLAVTILTQAKVRAPISDRKIYATAQEYWTAMQEWMERKPVAAKGVFVDIPDTEPSI